MHFDLISHPPPPIQTYSAFSSNESNESKKERNFQVSVVLRLSEKKKQNILGLLLVEGKREGERILESKGMRPRKLEVSLSTLNMYFLCPSVSCRSSVTLRYSSTHLNFVLDLKLVELFHNILVFF